MRLSANNSFRVSFRIPIKTAMAFTLAPYAIPGTEPQSQGEPEQAPNTCTAMPPPDAEITSFLSPCVVLSGLIQVPNSGSRDRTALRPCWELAVLTRTIKMAARKGLIQIRF